MNTPDWLQSTLKWLVLLALAFALLFLAFDTELSTEMAAPCSFSGRYGPLLKPCSGGSPYAGAVFAVVVIFVVASAFGRVVVALKLNLPPLLGMLIAGLLLKNLPFIGDVVGDNVNPAMSTHIRDVALALILCRAGLGLDLATLAKMKWVIVRLAFMPCTAEAITVACLSRQFLNFDWMWAIALGWLWSAISPAVVVPSLLSLLERGYGINTGIVPAAIAASALDDVASIVFFSIFLNFAVLDKQFEAVDLLQVPLQLVVGLVVGIVVAIVLVFATKPDSRGETPALDTNRLAALVAAAAVSLLALKKVDFTGCAALAVLVLALCAAKGWGPAASKRVAAPLTQIWNQLAQPLLFGLVGCQVDVTILKPDTVGFGVFFLVCGLIARFGTAYLSMTGRGLNWKERLFTALSQLPKATVQAALCGIPLANVHKNGVGVCVHPNSVECECIYPKSSQCTDHQNQLHWAQQLLQMAVVIILCTAPPGATIISVFGPKLLSRDGDDIAKDQGESLVPEVDEPDPDVLIKVLSFQATSFNANQAQFIGGGKAGQELSANTWS